jgi:hypothetical protein
MIVFDENFEFDVKWIPFRENWTIIILEWLFIPWRDDLVRKEIEKTIAIFEKI